MKLTLQDKLKLVEKVLGTLTQKEKERFRQEVIKLTVEEFLVELKKIKKGKYHV